MTSFLNNPVHLDYPTCAWWTSCDLFYLSGCLFCMIIFLTSNTARCTADASEKLGTSLKLIFGDSLYTSSPLRELVALRNRYSGCVGASFNISSKLMFLVIQCHRYGDEATQMSNGESCFKDLVFLARSFTNIVLPTSYASDQFQGSNCTSGSLHPPLVNIHQPCPLFLFFCPYLLFLLLYTSIAFLLQSIL